MFQIAEFSKKSSELKMRTIQALEKANLEFDTIKLLNTENEPIRLVFAGQYSAGKSSIMKMLTGRDDIAIGAGITTQKAHTYDWNGLQVVDTPGIHTQLRHDHDEISYRAIAGADMLVFVVTNELFDAHLAQHFRKLAIDHDKAGEMILVVNKMERTSEGNTIEQQQIIREDLEKVIAPYKPEDLNLCFLDAESYLESIDERDSDPEIADELLMRSGYTDFIATLNNFVSEKSITSRLTTKLYLMEDALQKGILALEPKYEDDDINALEEHFMQQRHILVDARYRLQREVKDIFSGAASEIRELGLNSANLISEGCNQEVVEVELSTAIDKVNRIIDSSQHEAKEIIETRLKEIEREFDIVENSEFSKELKARLTMKFDKLPQNIKNILNGAGKGMQNAGKAVINNAYKAGANGGLKLANFSGSNVHNIVLKVGHAIGYKFKPWQAIKITKGVAIAGQAFAALGVVFSIGMQIKSDSDEEKMRNQLKDNRQNIRSQFNGAAKELEDFGRDYAKKYVCTCLDEPITDIDANIEEIRKNRNERSLSCKELEHVLTDCRKLIHDIHQF